MKLCMGVQLWTVVKMLLRAYLARRTDRQTGRKKIGRQTDERTDKQTDWLRERRDTSRHTDRWTDRRTNGLLDGRIDRRKEGWANGQRTDGPTDRRTDWHRARNWLTHKQTDGQTNYDNADVYCRYLPKVILTCLGSYLKNVFLRNLNRAIQASVLSGNPVHPFCGKGHNATLKGSTFQLDRLQLYSQTLHGARKACQGQTFKLSGPLHRLRRAKFCE